MNRILAICCSWLCCLLAGCNEEESAAQLLGTLERERVELTAEAHEPIIGIEVREGQHVVAGTALLKLSLGAMQPRLDQASARVAQAQQRLSELAQGPRAQQILEARAALEAARSTASTEANEFVRVHDMVQRQLTSRSALDQARARRDTALSSQRQAQARLDLLLEGTRREEVEQAAAALKQAEAALAEVRASAERYVVRAPRAGRIEAIPYKLGERPPAAAPVIVMLADATTFARVHVPQLQRSQYVAGTPVIVKLDGHAEGLAGVVRFISAEADFTPYYALTERDRTRLSYLAEVDLTDAAADGLPTGAPVQVLPAPVRAAPVRVADER
jgi:HlyD family secretion protein